MDFHKLVLTVLQTSIVKYKPYKIQYRNYKYFDSGKFNRYLKEAFLREYVDSCSKFDDIFLEVLNRHALLKKKIIRANHAPYVCKALRKAIMKRSCLEKVYFKKQDNHSLRAYKKQKYYFSRLYKKKEIQMKQQHITFLQRYCGKVLKSVQTLCSYSLIMQYQTVSFLKLADVTTVFKKKKTF